jgi:alkylation response protein AidB-like acyl-CoA dehydrogenase
MPSAIADLDRSIDEIAARWRAERAERQARRHLDRADFEMLRDAGLLKLAVPESAGGSWHSAASSARRVCEIYRRLASADPSVALVSTMHPTVIGFWLSTSDPSQPDWEEQRASVFASAAAGEQWGTITSEPGSGGDIARTRATATPTDAQPFLVGRSYAVTGDKHFGSGFGITDRMITTAIPEGESDPTVFVLDVRDRPWDASAGLSLTAEWDGMGMAATQSHAMRLEGAPAVRLAWNGGLDAIMRAAGPFVATMFTSVIVGVLDEAIGAAREQVRRKAEQLRAYERVEWSRAELDHWVAVQAYEGALRAIEGGDPVAAFHAALRAKEAVADLAEAALLRITRVLGGGTFSRRSPFAHWFEDVRALGFLRPPWALAYDGLFATSIE